MKPAAGGSLYFREAGVLASVSRTRNFMSGGFVFVTPDDCQEHRTLLVPTAHSGHSHLRREDR